MVLHLDAKLHEEARVCKEPIPEASAHIKRTSTVISSKKLQGLHREYKVQLAQAYLIRRRLAHPIFMKGASREPSICKYRSKMSFGTRPAFSAAAKSAPRWQARLHSSVLQEWPRFRTLDACRLQSYCAVLAGAKN